MFTSAKRKRDPEVETKEQPSLIFDSSFAWPREYLFDQVALLEDGNHFAAIRFCLAGNKVEIWNIPNKKCLFTHSTIGSALLLLKDNKLAIASTDNNIYLYQIDLPNSRLELLTSFTPDVSETYAMTTLRDGSLVIGSSTGSISIWNLDTQKKIATHQVGSTQITALDTRQDGSLVIAEDNGFISIYDLNNNKAIHKFNVNASMPKAIVLPDDTVVCSNNEGFIYHFDFAEGNPTSLHKQQISTIPITQLISMPDGLIGCFVEWENCYDLSFFEPSWIKKYVNNVGSEETKTILQAHLPKPLAQLVVAYAANITFFSSPKMPNKEECVLAKELPTLTRS